NVPVYWCGEELPAIDNDFIQIFHPCVEADHWTTKLRAQIEQIPEEYIFVWLDDLIPQMDISITFGHLYELFTDASMDALRIMGRKSAASYEMAGHCWGSAVYKLTPYSRYRVSFSPNIYHKSFLLEVLQRDESPWACELNSRGQFQDRDIYAYHINGWYENRIVQ
ncbi:MAG: hypothetical protein IZT57_05130, partial [Chloroflexi bacterium]|nr:hypothetical protein [Chloroflexota bacterium]